MRVATWSTPRVISFRYARGDSPLISRQICAGSSPQPYRSSITARLRGGSDASTSRATSERSELSARSSGVPE